MGKLPDKSYYEGDKAELYKKSFNTHELEVPEWVENELAKVEESKPYVNNKIIAKNDNHGDLYPMALYKIYKSVLIDGNFSFGYEKECDALMKKFLDEKAKSVGPQKYYKELIASMSLTAKRLTQLRAIVATFGGNRPQDSLPEKLRKSMVKSVGVDRSTLDGWQRELEAVTRSADIDSVILGRIGYMALWYSIKGGHDVAGYLTSQT